MAATSVTGVGNNYVESNRTTLGVDKLIGPRWTDVKEKEFASLKETSNKQIQEIVDLNEKVDYLTRFSFVQSFFLWAALIVVMAKVLFG